MFDASKLEVGKKYPTRSFGPARFVADSMSHGMSNRLVWICNENHVFTTGINGMWAPDQIQAGEDVLSSDPIKEPVSMQCPPQWAAVFRDGTTSIGYTSKERAIAYAKDQGCIGVYELPETIKVQPV